MFLHLSVSHSVHRWGVPALEGSGPGGVPAPWGGLVPGGWVWSGGCLLLGGVPDGDPPGTAIAAGGTHPTGMHSCHN